MLGVPVVDLLLPEEKAALQLRHACEEHGFFLVSNHGVPERLIEEQFEQSHRFFRLPLEQKMELLSDAKSRGYSPLYEQKLDPQQQPLRGDAKESIYIWGGKVSPPKDSPQALLPLHGPNQWPPDAWDLQQFRPVMEEYLEHIEELLGRVNRLLALALDLPADYFDSKFDRAVMTLRPIHYTAEGSDPERGLFAAGAHTDWGHLTFLVTDGTPGLQIDYQGSWVDVPHVPGCFICNLGDLTERWTNGRYKSTRHRVINTAKTERFSCACFTSPNYDTKVECLPTCLDQGPPEPPILVHQYLQGKYLGTHAQYAKLHRGDEEELARVEEVLPAGGEGEQLLP